MQTDNILLEDVFVIPNGRGVQWRDFGGTTSASGNPNFVIRMTEEQGKMLESMAPFNVKWPKAEWRAANPDKGNNPSLKVIASYRYFEPTIKVKINEEVFNFTKDELVDLDTARINYAAVVIRGTEVNFNGRKTFSAYLQEAYFELDPPRHTLDDLISHRR